MPKQKGEVVRRTQTVQVKFSQSEIENLKATAQEAGQMCLRGFVRRAALGEMAAFRRRKRVPEVNRRLYIELAALKELLNERVERAWDQEDREYMKKVLSLLQQVQKGLVGVADDR